MDRLSQCQMPNHALSNNDLTYHISLEDQQTSILRLSQWPITTIPSDVIVNSANPWLAGVRPDLSLMCGGVYGAIHRAAGIGLYNECINIPKFSKIYKDKPTYIRCDHGDLRTTHGYNLPCQKVFHAVAPVYLDGKSGELELLFTLYKKIFTAFTEAGFHSIALPPLGTRSFGMPRAESAFIALCHAIAFARRTSVEICFSLIDDDEFKIYRDTLQTQSYGSRSKHSAR